MNFTKKIYSNRFLTTRGLKKDILIVTFLILLPFTFYLYNLTPKSDTWIMLGIELNSNYFGDVNFFLWILGVKVLTLFLLLIWYYTSIYNWKYILIIPICLEVRKIIYLLKIEYLGFEELLSFTQNVLTVITTVLLVLLIDFILNHSSRNTVDLKLNNALNNEINKELEELAAFRGQDFNICKQEFSDLLHVKNDLSKKQYLGRLISLRDKMSKIN